MDVQKNVQKKPLGILMMAIVLTLGITGCSFNENNNSGSRETVSPSEGRKGQTTTNEINKETESDTEEDMSMQQVTTPSINEPEMELYDVVFIGDSRTEGLFINTGGAGAQFIYHKGLMVDTALTNNEIKLKDGTMGTVIDALKEMNYKKVYIMFGVNELGWPNENYFKQKYTNLVQAVQEVNKEADICVQSILPITKSKSDNDNIYNNGNVIRLNKVIKIMTEETGSTYVDVAAGLFGEGGVLPEDSSNDGVHFNKEYYIQWLQYIIAHNKVQ